MLLQDTRDLSQHLVTGDVALHVVDQLEPLELEVTECVLTPTGSAAGEQWLEPAHEGATIDEPGQGIVLGLVAQPSRQLDRFGDVLDFDDEVGRFVGALQRTDGH